MSAQRGEPGSTVPSPTAEQTGPAPGDRPGTGLKVLVATVVHHPGDARIAHREMGALLDAGFEVTFLAPDATPSPGPVLELPEAAPRQIGRHGPA